jgi:hypothetical protein
MEKYGFVYIWFDSYRKMYYIGCHWGTEDDGYICSSDRMREAYYRRPHDFKRRILARVYSREAVFEEEYKWLSLIKNEELTVKYYNIKKNHWKHWAANPDSRTTRQKISENTKAAMQNPEVRANYLEGLKARNTRSSEVEVREKRRQSMMGKNVGKVHTEEQNERNRQRALGRKHSEQTKRKMALKSKFKMSACVHCGTEGNVATLARYHNNNCKQQSINI